MDYKDYVAMTRLGDASLQACAMRLSAARLYTGLSKTEFCKQAGVSLTSYLNAEAARSFPSRKVMLYLYRSHRVDFNFVLHGDFVQLPADVQRGLLDALAERGDGLEPEEG